jgi:phosphosulfolactate synthase (CoM biosynthesis protein A)
VLQRKLELPFSDYRPILLNVKLFLKKKIFFYPQELQYLHFSLIFLSFGVIKMGIQEEVKVVERTRRGVKDRRRKERKRK